MVSFAEDEPRALDDERPTMESDKKGSAAEQPVGAIDIANNV
jgi:hypothetical protein